MVIETDCEEGNRRFMNGRPWGSTTQDAARQQLVVEGQAPHTAIIGCADSRAPLETIFDAMPGQSVLKNDPFAQNILKS